MSSSSFQIQTKCPLVGNCHPPWHKLGPQIESNEHMYIESLFQPQQITPKKTRRGYKHTFEKTTKIKKESCSCRERNNYIKAAVQPEFEKNSNFENYEKNEWADNKRANRQYLALLILFNCPYYLHCLGRHNLFALPWKRKQCVVLQEQDLGIWNCGSECWILRHLWSEY